MSLSCDFGSVLGYKLGQALIASLSFKRSDILYILLFTFSKMSYKVLLSF